MSNIKPERWWCKKRIVCMHKACTHHGTFSSRKQMKNLLSHKINDWEIWLYRKLMWRQVRAQQTRLYRAIYSGTGSSLSDASDLVSLASSLVHLSAIGKHQRWRDTGEIFFFSFTIEAGKFRLCLFVFDSRHTRLTFDRRLKEVLICFSTRKQFNARRKRKTWNVNFFSCCFIKRFIDEERGRREKSFQFNGEKFAPLRRLLWKSSGLF